MTSMTRQTTPAADTRRPRLKDTPGPVILLYAAAAYALSLLVTGYAAGFMAGAGVPKDIDDGAGTPWPAAVAADTGLLLLFAAQHSVMARRRFKDALARRVPAAAERATYVLCASLTLALLFWLWRPVPATVWHLTGPAAAVVTAAYAAGWVIAVSATFMISHTDLFGLRQACRHARRAAYAAPPFTQRGLYRVTRHPLMTGFLVVFWAAPVMTAGHLLFAALATGYILAGTALEERDLLRDLGEVYGAYRARVPGLIPLAGRRRRRAAGPGTARDRL